MTTIRPPAVAGTFYPAAPAELEATVRELLAAAAASARPSPKAVIAPHAGYVYSGAIAASAFAPLVASPGVRRIVLIGPSHFVPLRGLALPDASGFETPLGIVPVDAELAERVAALPGVERRADAHRREHSLEVELPFLQAGLPDFTLLPLVVGEAEPGAVADVLEAVWGEADTRVVVSSDLSHYLTYEVASEMDRETAETILALAPIAPVRACGAMAVNGLLEVARRRGLAPNLLDLRNSGDTAGDRHRVVGYGAFAFHEAAHEAA
jgi:AmmeMemoRadiSam system protein B